MNIAEEYIEDIKSEEITACKWVKKAIDRHLLDIQRSNEKDFPYYFDSDIGEQYVSYFQYFKHAKGRWRGKPFNLMPWHAFIVYSAYGWLRKENDKRRFNKIYIKVARKNAKTEFLACIGTIGFMFDNEIDSEIYWFATKKEQAKIGWNRQKEIVKQLRQDVPEIAQYCDLSTYRIYTNEGAGFVSYLGQDSHTEDGLSPYYGLCDEYHAHRNDGMMNVIESGMGTRNNPMTWIITTAGFNSNGPCASFEKNCKQILEGQLKNEEIFALIYDLDDDDDWNDESVWIKANPSLGVSITLDWLRSEYQRAKTQGESKIISFKTKNLNIWTTTHSTFIPDEIYQSRAIDIAMPVLDGKDCIAALDLSSKRDTTAITLLFPPQEGLDQYFFLRLCWLPEETAQEREKNDAIPYSQWAADGHIYLTPGNAIDYDYIFQTITGLYDSNISRVSSEKLYDGEGLAKKYNVLSIAYDRWREEQVVTKLSDAGITMEPFGQGFRSMSTPTDELEVMFYNEMLVHDGNPVARWHYSNVAMRSDPAGNRKPDKSTSNEKIDLVVTDIMALGEWLDVKKKQEDDESVYNTRDMYII